MIKAVPLCAGLALLLLAACGSGPGVAPEPSSSPEQYNGDLPTGTSNDIYHGR